MRSFASISLSNLLAFAFMLATPAAAQTEPDSEGVTLAWISPTQLDVTANVGLPTGCHHPGDIRATTPKGSAAVTNALAVTVSITVEDGMCTQDYRIHRFNLTIDAPTTAAGLILYETRNGREIQARLYALPKRKK